MLNGAKIIIGITGSIAAYKMPYLIRLLKKDGADVQVLLTPAARDFVTPLTLSTLSCRPVYSGFFSDDDGTWNSHVDFGNWADLLLIAPASATTLGKMVAGIADNLLVATYLAAKCPVMFAPAMDVDMFLHPSTQANIKRLASVGNICIEPSEGELASGLSGMGRLKEPQEMHEIIRSFFEKKKDCENLHVLITAGPTYEPIDPVRFIGNHSSGKMGYALANEFAARGATVDMVSGPVTPQPLSGNIMVYHAGKAQEMYDQTLALADRADVIIMAAAVSDFTPVAFSDRKIKKETAGESFSLELKKTPDILAALGKRKKEHQTLIGFALETDKEKENAEKKLLSKNPDFIVLNSLREQGAGFGTDTNKVTIISHKGEVIEYGLKSKTEVAADIADYTIIFRKKRLL